MIRFRTNIDYYTENGKTGFIFTGFDCGIWPRSSCGSNGAPSFFQDGNRGNDDHEIDDYGDLEHYQYVTIDHYVGGIWSYKVAW